jgi:GAF domain-containing protein
VTELKQAQDAAQRRAQLLAAAAEIGRAATASLDLDTLLRTSVNLIRDRFGFYHASIFIIDSKTNMAVVRESTGEAGAALKARGHQLAVGSNSLVGRATATRQPVVVQDVTTDLTHFKNPLLPDTRAEAVLPLLSADRVIGALDVQSALPNAFAAEDMAILATIADQLAVAIQNANLFDRTARTARRERLVGEITNKIRAAGSVEAMLQTAVTELRQALGVSHGLVKLGPPDSEPKSGGDGRGSNGSKGNGASGVGA